MNNLIRMACTSIVISLLMTSFTYAQSSADVYKTLKKLEARIQIGINHNDYVAALGDAQYKMNMFVETQESKKKPKLVESLNKTIAHYIYAKNLFDDWVGGTKCLQAKLSGNEIEVLKEYSKEMVNKANIIIKDYPEASKAISNGNCSDGYMDIKKVMDIVWRKASDELKKTSKMI